MDSVTFTPETICSTFKKLKPTTSLGHYNIPNVLLKKCAYAPSVSLAHIFDTSFTVRKLPIQSEVIDIFSEIQDGGRRDLGFVGEPWDHPRVGHGLGPSMGWVGLGWVKT